MGPVSKSILIARPREEVFDYLADMANRPEFTDHYLHEFRLTRVDSFGRGAGARFRVAVPLRRFTWADATFVEVDAPHRIVEVGRFGKYNRIRRLTTFTLSPAPANQTRVEMTTETEPRLPTDRIVEGFGARGWWKRKTAKALRRLRGILEGDPDVKRGARATVAGS